MSKLLRWLSCTGLCVVFCMGVAGAELPSQMDDSQLSDIYAAGFNIQIDFDLDVAAQDPNALVIDSTQIGAIEEIANQYVTKTAEPGMFRSSGGLDESGAIMPNLQALTSNTLTISDNAMQNAQTLLNIIAMNGDVAVGMNLNIIINPIDSPISIMQTNLNWSNVDFSDMYETLGPPSIR